MRILVKEIVSKCIACCKRKNNFCTQLVGQLAIERIQPSSPFSPISIDLFGSYSIRGGGSVQKSIRGKCCGVIFAYMVSRVVYIGATKNYATVSFMQVLCQFTCARGRPNKIFSDQGSQIVAASKEFQDIIKGIDWDLLKRYSVNHNTTWGHNTEY